MRSFKTLTTLILAICILLSSAPVLFYALVPCAQAVDSVTGSVHSSYGRSIDKATVEISNNSRTLTYITDASGLFIASGDLNGLYSIVVKHTGFKDKHTVYDASTGSIGDIIMEPVPYNVTLFVGSASIISNGSDSTTISAKLVDIYGEAMPDYNIVFKVLDDDANSGVMKLQPSDAGAKYITVTTNATGYATASFGWSNVNTRDITIKVYSQENESAYSNTTIRVVKDTPRELPRTISMLDIYHPYYQLNQNGGESVTPTPTPEPAKPTPVPTIVPVSTATPEPTVYPAQGDNTVMYILAVIGLLVVGAAVYLLMFRKKL